MNHATVHGYGRLQKALGSRWLDGFQRSNTAVGDGQINGPLLRGCLGGGKA